MNKIVRPYSFGKMENVKDFEKAMKDTGIEIPCSEDVSVLGTTWELDGKTIENRLCVHPCEGFDGTIDGKPSDLIKRRYARYAKGGSGAIWYEAIAVAPDGRCNPYQMMIIDETVDSLKELVANTNEISMKEHGFKPYNIIQLTHSGRSSVDTNWKKIPLIAFANPYEDPYYPNITIASDERIEQLRDEVIHGAELAVEAGFDAVDIKLCHNYIMRELLAGFTRPGKYGGSYENRTRFLFEVIAGIREKVGDKITICARINAYDCIPYPYGWGMVKEEGVMDYDLSEPIRLIKDLVAMNIRLFNVSTMMPRFSPKNTGYHDSHEGKAELNPFESTSVLLKATKEIKEAVPEAILVATGLTWFDRFGGNVAAGGIEEGWFDVGGFGRQAMAYPDYAKDLVQKKEMDGKKCCVTCDKCYELNNNHEFAGCVIRDETYTEIYKKVLQKKRESK